MTLREKGFWWRLTWPFAQSNFTTVGDVLYHPRGRLPSALVIAHEEIHARQQTEYGVVKYVFRYLCWLPLFYNPFRFKAEMEAYLATGTSREKATGALASSAYGWLVPSWHGER